MITMVVYFGITFLLSFFAGVYAIVACTAEGFQELSILPWYIAKHENLNVFGVVLYSTLALFIFPFLWVVEFFVWLFTDACTKK